jgi:hypothetical protein
MLHTFVEDAMSPISRAILACGLFLTVPLTFADALRCGTALVAIGDSELTLLQQCGEPTAKDGNRWFYDTDDGQFPMIVEVGDGQVLNITTSMEERP